MPRGPRGPIEKPKDRKKVLLRLWTYIYAHKWMALAAVLLTVSSNLLALLGPMLSGEAIDAIVVNLAIQPVDSVEKIYVTITVN